MKTLILTSEQVFLLKKAVDIATQNAIDTLKQVRAIGIDDSNNAAIPQYNAFSKLGAALSDNDIECISLIAK